MSWVHALVLHCFCSPRIEPASHATQPWAQHLLPTIPYINGPSPPHNLSSRSSHLNIIDRLHDHNTVIGQLLHNST
jgi:hypothetical protein